MAINILLFSRDYTKKKELGIINPELLQGMCIKYPSLRLLCYIDPYDNTFFNAKQSLMLKNEVSMLAQELSPSILYLIEKIEQGCQALTSETYYFLVFVGD